jgi:hypothetical protein
MNGTDIHNPIIGDLIALVLLRPILDNMFVFFSNLRNRNNSNSTSTVIIKQQIRIPQYLLPIIDVILAIKLRFDTRTINAEYTAVSIQKNSTEYNASFFEY